MGDDALEQRIAERYADAIADRPRGIPWPPLILIALVTVVSFAVVLLRARDSDERGPTVLTDTAFIAEAGRACAAAFPALRPTETNRDDIVGATEIAAQTRKAADGLEQLKTQLRGLPAVAQDTPFVTRWLDDWGTFIDTGRRYAATLDTGDVRAANKVATSGDEAQERADAFARANGLDACELRAAFVAPPRRSAL